MRTFLAELTKALKTRSEVLLPEAPHYRRLHQSQQIAGAPAEYRLRAAAGTRSQHAWWQ